MGHHCQLTGPPRRVHIKTEQMPIGKFVRLLILLLEKCIGKYYINIISKHFDNVTKKYLENIEIMVKNRF